MPVIYIDVRVALNLLIDFLLLSATARLLRLPRRRWRLVLGAFAGALSACLVLLPDPPPLLSVLVKLASAALIVRLSFRWFGMLSYIKQLAVFFISSALFAGLAYALWFFAAPDGFYVMNGVVYYNVSPLMLTVLTVISYGAIWLYDRFTAKKTPAGREYRLLIDCGRGTASVRALHDTGNGLTDAFTGSPVAVVNAAALEGYLPDELATALRRSTEDPCTVADAGPASESGEAPGGAAVRTRLRLIPFQSLGGTGLLPAFRPRHLTVVAPNGTGRDVSGAFVAVAPSLGRGEYQALIGSDIAALLEGLH